MKIAERKRASCVRERKRERDSRNRVRERAGDREQQRERVKETYTRLERRFVCMKTTKSCGLNFSLTQSLHDINDNVLEQVQKRIRIGLRYQA